MVLGLLAASCSSSDRTGERDPSDATIAPEDDGTDAAFAFPELPVGEQREFPPAPSAPDGPLDAELQAHVDNFFGVSLDPVFLEEEWDALEAIGEAGDPRLAWLISDLLRIANGPELLARLINAAQEATGADIDDLSPWGDLTDHLIAWDTPAPPDYLRYKRNIYTLVEPAWEPLMADGYDVDWRMVSWGGVLIDARPFGTTDDDCSCIPAADNPPVTSAADATWLDDSDVVFGVEIAGEARAYPRQIMEVREMVNDTLGGRDIGMPYCTLCGSAQVYFTDDLPDGVERPVLRTSGLLTRSNKVMYDLVTQSVLDTFTGEALTGPLADAAIVLEQAGVVTTTWGQWRTEHPDTTVLVEDLALGRDPDFRNNRDANGPIFPIGDVDPRLAVQEDVLGVVTASGTPVAFHVASAVAALEAGRTVSFENVELVLDGGGVRAVDENGDDVGGHQAFWFAWSQFHPGTALWPADQA